MPVRPRSTLPAFVFALALVCAGTATAQVAPSADSKAGEEYVRERGFSVSLGYAHAIQNVRHPDEADVTEPQMLVMSAQLFAELADWRRSGRHGGSALDIVLEPQLLVNFSPSAGFAGAVTAGFRWRFLRNAGWQPFLVGVAGIGGTDFDLVYQDDGFQFWLEGGIGVRRPLASGRSLLFETRFHHISNAGTHPPNLGIDSVLFTVGVEF